MQNNYAGESIAKKVARVRLYLRVRDMLRAVGRDSGPTVLVLPGPEAAEIGCLEHLLKPSLIYVVDRDDDCVQNFFDKSADQPYLGQVDYIGYTGEMSDFEPVPNAPIDFAHLDLMGNLNGDPGGAARCLGTGLPIGCIIALTYLRGRETGNIRRDLNEVKDMNLLSHASRQARKRWGSDRARTLGMFSSIQMGMIRGYIDANDDEFGDLSQTGKLLAARDFWAYSQMKHGLQLTPIASYCYQANTSPMGVMAVQLIDRSLDTKKYGRWIDGKMRKTLRKSWETRLINCTLPRDSLVTLLKEADCLERDGFTKQQVADIFNVSVGTMAAWKAHRTMGRYSGK